MKKISVIVVNYNTTELVRNLERKYSSCDLEFIVVDNSSNYDRLLDNTILISGHGNVGFGKACNLGAKRSTQQKLLFLNPDADLSIDSLKTLCSYHKDPLDIVGPIIYEKGKTVSLLLNSNIPGLIYLRKEFRVESILTEHQDSLFVSGACMLITKDNFKRLCGFDESVFLYAEDLDICIRNTLQGGRNIVIKNAEIKHTGGESSVTKFQLAGKLKRLKNSYDGHYLILRKQYKPVKSFFNALYLASGITI
ncbi:glycosyltransferase family 2 protein [Photobacterium swingsii]|uniref:glycosyltransferase family 2 protein n=1 Tax=Photobacterium swingsii TaxID=680026 RepID=UPI0040679529